MLGTVCVPSLESNMIKYQQFDLTDKIEYFQNRQKKLSFGFGVFVLISLTFWSVSLLFFLHQANQVIIFLINFSKKKIYNNLFL